MWRAKRVYADAASATPLSPSAKKELVRLLDTYGNPGALHKEAVDASHELLIARETAAGAIGAHADEIIWTSGGTESNNLALVGLLRPLMQSGERVHVVVSAIEHASVLEPLRALVAEGLELTELPVEPSGRIAIQSLRDAMQPHTRLVSIQFVNSEIGTVQPLREIAKEIRRVRKERGAQGQSIFFHTDASQAPLWKTIRVDTLGVDLLTLDGQKILGPKGVGLLYIRRKVVLQAQVLGGGQEGGLRSGTQNVPLVGSFAVALKDAQANEETAASCVAPLRNMLLSEILARIPAAVVHGAVGDERVANNLAISIPHLDGQMAVIALSALGVSASTRSACDTENEEPSHVLIAIGVAPELMQCAIRFSLLPEVTKRDIRTIADSLSEVAQRYQNMA